MKVQINLIFHWCGIQYWQSSTVLPAVPLAETLLSSSREQCRYEWTALLCVHNFCKLEREIVNTSQHFQWNLQQLLTDLNTAPQSPTTVSSNLSHSNVDFTSICHRCSSVCGEIKFSFKQLNRRMPYLMVNGIIRTQVKGHLNMDTSTTQITCPRPEQWVQPTTKQHQELAFVWLFTTPTKLSNCSFRRTQKSPRVSVK